MRENPFVSTLLSLLFGLDSASSDNVKQLPIRLCILPELPDNLASVI
jgi:hypothetical protein